MGILKNLKFMEKANISKSDVEKIAYLARIELDEAEKEKFTRQFENILAFVNELQNVDTSGVEEISQIAGLENVWREDEAGKSLSNEEALKNAPASEKGYFKVKEIL